MVAHPRKVSVRATLAQSSESADQQGARLAVAAETLAVSLDELVKAVSADNAHQVGADAVLQSATAMVAVALAFVTPDRKCLRCVDHWFVSLC